MGKSTMTKKQLQDQLRALQLENESLRATEDTEEEYEENIKNSKETTCPKVMQKTFTEKVSFYK